jgi:hypothetical protein
LQIRFLLEVLRLVAGGLDNSDDFVKLFVLLVDFLLLARNEVFVRLSLSLLEFSLFVFLPVYRHGSLGRRRSVLVFFVRISDS